MNSMHPQDSYEQLKRKNRRRLVGAVVMVVVAGTILLSVLNQKHQPSTQQQEIALSGLAASDIAPPPQVVAADDHAEDLAPGAVLEPAPVSEADAATASGHIEGRTDSAATTGGVRVVPPSPPAKQPDPAATGKPAPAKPAETATPTKPAPVQQPERRTDTPAATPPAKAERPADGRTAAPTPANQAEAKPANPKPATPAETKAAAKPETTKPAAKPAAKPEPAKPAKLTPQDILNNKAANQVAKSQPAPSGPQAILNGQGGGKALIQVGAYTNEQQAVAVQQKLAAAGVQTTVSASQTSKGTLYRVRTGTYASRAQAEQNLNRIRAQGLDGMVIGQ